MRIRAVVLALVVAQAAWAQGPETSERPVVRGGNPSVQPVEIDPSGTIAQPEQSDVQEEKRTRGGLFSSIRPLFRSSKVEKEARAERKLRAKGAVCGDTAIQGEVVGRVPGRIAGCGIEDAVRVRSVAGIGLSQQAVIDCQTATALKTWLEGSAKPALARKGGGLTQIRVAAHYACRTRNNLPGAKVSEHGRGRAIDISGFRLADGTLVSVLEGWNTRRYRKPMRQMHKGACGPFGTVLGPNSDRFHRDHFHFDTARYRSGSYCR